MKTLEPSAPSVICRVTFQRERWADFLPQARPLFRQHWHEVGLNREAIPLDPDCDRYQKIEDQGGLYVLTGRSQGKLVAYLLALLSPHLHYKSAGLMAMTDIYYVDPGFRNGVGVALFAEFEKRMKALGVVQLITSCKKHLDHSRMLELMGYEWTDKTFMKVLCQ